MPVDWMSRMLAYCSVHRSKLNAGLVSEPHAQQIHQSAMDGLEWLGKISMWTDGFRTNVNERPCDEVRHILEVSMSTVIPERMEDYIAQTPQVLSEGVHVSWVMHPGRFALWYARVPAAIAAERNSSAATMKILMPVLLELHYPGGQAMRAGEDWP
ncbi:uncharacterized protein BP01DRAFT_362670 [Aspergillus saccharolyticus JOP 1030-1]|uniref:Uncharacterized protein n=1 Tax=Aspergillus saccharolyticus JOP 1030-1 TaxID=1450539 RepID=A0A318ZMU2_9EURO|nr:hypothetical protein BP01DRAFT_362670 [Aspergillus saccharolyticus JOP 1030-1]PYH48941.1 hypothetical protein BP01DRAFT_362670 [Aspergillus saccharolyticus JOP 1030-1]